LDILTNLPNLLTHSILPFAAILLALVTIHEAGHYVTAKMFGVKVLEAGVGFPPRIAGFRWRDTDYTINALPLGAFVRLLGEEDPSDPQSLAAQPKWKRTVIIGAGAAMNLVAAIALFTAGLMIPHTVSAGGAQIASVAPGSPAERAGLKEGDQILKVNGRTAESTQDASYLIRLYQGSTIDFTIKRPDPREGSSVLTTSAYARWNPQPYTDECGVKQPEGPTGISITTPFGQNVPRTAAETATLLESSKKGLTEYNKQVAAGSPPSCYAGRDFGFRSLTTLQCSALEPDAQAQAQALKQELFSTSGAACFVFAPPPKFAYFTRKVHEPIWTAVPHSLRLTGESTIMIRNQLWTLARGFAGKSPITGPVGIAHVTGEVVDAAGWLTLIQLAASISMSLALINVMPIPMVDGGRLAFILIEFLRRGKRVAPEKEALVHLIGFAAMLIGFAVVTYFDIVRIIGGDSLLR
jgi:regulator of sigma E protease